MSANTPSAVLRVVGWQIAFAAALSLGGAAGFFYYLLRGSSALPIAGWALLFAGALVAFAHTWTTRIVLRQDDLLVVHNFRRRLLARERIDSVRSERGSGVTIRMVDGECVRLPETGHDNPCRADRIRSWLKAPRPAGSSRAGKKRGR